MRSAIYYILAVTIATLASSPVWSEEAATVLVEPSALTKNVVEYVANIGKPSPVFVTSEQTIGELVSSHCGTINEHYIKVLRTRVPGLPKNFELETPLATSGIIELPACLYLPKKLEHKPYLLFSRSAPLAPYYLRRNSSNLKIASNVCNTWNNHLWRDMEIRDDIREYADKLPWDSNDPTAETGRWAIALKNGEMALRPYPTTLDVESMFETNPDLEEFLGTLRQKNSLSWSSVVIRPGLKLSSVEAGQQIALRLVEGGQKESAAVFDRSDPDEIELYSRLTDEELFKLNACQPRPEAAIESAGDVLQLVEVLSYNLQRLAKNGKTPDRALIVIPDTGLYTDGQLPFPTSRVKVLNTQAPGLNQISPYKGYEKHQHGTYVATLALGGPSLIKIIESLGLKLEIAPVNVFDEKFEKCGKQSCPKYRVKIDGFSNAIEEAANWSGGSAIVNLSVGQQKPFTAITRHLKEGNVLFVVAAGNDGEPLLRRAVYPARYGGDNEGKDNLITVAAVDLNGARANFSNHGESYVDIAAPGCWRPVFDYDVEAKAYRVSMASGTSFAAPSVSFVAALLRATWHDATPRDIKRRILTSSDFSPGLQRTEIKDGRLLNPVKALAVYQDVVEAKVNGKKMLLRGQIDESLKIFDFCGGSLSLHRLRGTNQSLIKKVTATEEPASSFIIYWQNPDGIFNRNICPRKGFSLKMRDDLTNWQYDIAAEDIVDVVFSEPTN